jgi:hypothetical protein
MTWKTRRWVERWTRLSSFNNKDGQVEGVRRFDDNRMGHAIAFA